MRSKRNTQVTNKDYDIVVGLLQKKEKSQRDLETIFNKISSLNGFNQFISSYFQGSDVSEQIKICGDLVYEKKNKGDIIFQQDEPSNNKLYIILKGSCMVFLLKDLDFQDEEEEMRRQQELEQQQQQNSNQQQEAHFKEMKEKEIEKVSVTVIDRLKQIGQRYKNPVQIDYERSNMTLNEVTDFKKRYGKTTRLLPAGSVFGERALLTNQARTATIIAESHPTELVILDRDKFLPALEELKRTLQLRRDILFQIFKDMDNYSSARLESMLYTFSVLTFNRGHYITEQDQNDDKIFIIAEGEAQIQKRIPIQISEQHTEEKLAKLTIIGSGVMVGDEIMLKGEQKYLYTTEVISLKAQVLMADKKIIDRKFPKDLKDYLRRLSVNKEKGRKVLLEHKEEEIRNELLVQMKKDSHKKLMMTQYKNRTEDETNEMMKKFKEAINNRSSFVDVQQPGSYQHFEESQMTSQKEILRGAVQVQVQQPKQNQNQEYFQSNLQLPQLNEKSLTHIKDDFQINTLTMRGGKDPHLQSSNNIFDVKSQVFDFGDGKNIQNAQRIEKILNAKNKKRKDPHFSGNNATLQQQLEKNVKQNKNDLHMYLLSDMNSIQSYITEKKQNITNKYGSSSTTNRNRSTEYDIAQLAERTSQNKNHRYPSDYYQQNSGTFSSLNILGQGTMNSDIFSSKSKLLPLISKEQHNVRNSDPNIQLQSLQESQSLSIIHSSKNKLGNEDQNQKGNKKPYFKVLVNNNTSQIKLNSQQQFQDAQVLGTLHLSPKRIQKLKLEVMDKHDKKRSLLFGSKSKTQAEDMLIGQNGLNSNPSLGLFVVDNQDGQSYADITKQHPSIAQISQKEIQNESVLEQKRLSSLPQSANYIPMSYKYNNNASGRATIDEKIKEIDSFNSFNDNPNTDVNQQEQQRTKASSQGIEEAKLINTPLRKNIKSNNGSVDYTIESNTQPSSHNKHFNKIMTRNAGGFFPLTVSKPNKILSSQVISSRTLSLKKGSQQKEDPNLNNIFKSNHNSAIHASLIGKDANNTQQQNQMYSSNNNNQLREYFSVINYNKAKSSQFIKDPNKLPSVLNS